MKKIPFISIVLLSCITLSSCTMIYKSMKEKRNRTYNEGVTLYNQKKYEEAYDKFDTVVSIDPEYKKSKDYLKRSEAYLKRKEQNIKQRANENYSRGIKLKKAKQYEAALDAFLLSKQQNPDYEDIDDQIDECRNNLTGRFKKLFAQASNQYKAKQYKNSYNTCLNAKKIKSDSELSSLMGNIESALNDKSRPYRNAGGKFYSNGNYEKAKGQLATALNINPWDKEAKELMDKTSSMLNMSRDYKAAVDLYNRGQSLPAYGKFLAISQKNPQYKDTASYLEKSKAQLSKNIGAYYNSGVQQYDKENFEAAINEFNKVLLVNPDHKSALEYRQRAQAKLDIKKSLGGTAQ